MSVGCTKVIVVLGMHRSGTSAITRALEVFGVGLGDNLMPPAEGNNEKGFFEDLDIHDFNTRLLHELGSAWDQLDPIEAHMIDALAPAFLDQACALLRSKLEGLPIFAFKEPQTALLLSFWRRVLERLGVEVSYLICQRHPLSVAESLYKRDGMDPVRGQLLWVKYQLAALRQTVGQPRLVVDYDRLMDQPKEQLSRLARAFGLSAPESNPHRLASFCEEFLAGNLRHSQHDEEHLADTRRVTPPARVLHALLRQAAHDNVDLQSHDFTTRCRQLDDQISSQQALALTIDRLDQEHARLVQECARMDQAHRRLESDFGQLSLQHASLADECQSAWAMHDRAQRDKQELGNELAHSLQRETELRGDLARIYRSKTWRVMRPLRVIRRYSNNPMKLLRLIVAHAVRGVWTRLPLSFQVKQQLKSAIFRFAGALLKRTQAYQNWQRFNNEQPAPAHSPNTVSLKLIDEPVQHVKRLQGAGLINAPVRLIAFYLPQFHPIAENNQWWGEGFTEWTNVKPAQPLYAGHHQPHVPGDLGYYDLEDVETQRRQVELARLYGIGGFCFYFYWFGGKRLLENPVLQYLQNTDLDLPFCLCWANENWSRRWDGLDSEILIGQQHSAEDDLAFIAYVAKYMRDSRYIRIEGKPLLLVYRPGLLPNPKQTAERWRHWCREQGLGEIYLAYTQSFETVAPSRYGFDAAIEFPPNSTQPPEVTQKMTPLQDDFSGQVFDWSVYLKRSAEYRRPDYTLFRGVCPSWDNTARRKNRSTSFVNSSPRGYQEWLFNAIRDTQLNARHADEQLVFINAWNEWAEGAYLEPDARQGYGYLEATRMASVRAGLQQRSVADAQTTRLAVVIHAYYPDVFREILDSLEQVQGVALKLFVSCPPEAADQVGDLLVSSSHAAQLEVLPNHGRDVLPFLKLMPRVLEEGFDYLLKVHTKKSTHRDDGDVWRRDLYDKLLTEGAMQEALATFAENPTTGVLSPAGHLVAMTYYWGSNAKTVEKLACRLGIRPRSLAALNFAAGTMFFAQTRALQPLLNLALDDQDFEVEAGQVDGTMAHAIERSISVSALAAGFDVRSGVALDESKLEYAFAESTQPAL